MIHSNVFDPRVVCKEETLAEGYACPNCGTQHKLKEMIVVRVEYHKKSTVSTKIIWAPFCDWKCFFDCYPVDGNA